MATNIFEAVVRHQAGKAIIDLQGEINSFAEAELNEAYSQAAEGDARLIVLNFTNVDYINSTGIALIVGLLAQARKTHRQLAVYGLSDHYVEIFNITRLSDFMQIFPDEQAALAAV